MAAQVSRLSGLLRALVNIFATVAPSVEVKIGERYATQEGAANRIVIVPDRGPMGVSTKLSAGHVGGVALGATAHLWGASAALPASPIEADVLEADLAGYDGADDLLDLFVNALQRAAPGRVELKEIVLVDGMNLENFGEVYRVKFTYTRGIPKISAIANLAATPTDPTAPASAAIPGGPDPDAPEPAPGGPAIMLPNSPPNPARTPGAAAVTVATSITSEPQ